MQTRGAGPWHVCVPLLWTLTVGSLAVTITKPAAETPLSQQATASAVPVGTPPSPPTPPLSRRTHAITPYLLRTGVAGRRSSRLRLYPSFWLPGDWRQSHWLYIPGGKVQRSHWRWVGEDVGVWEWGGGTEADLSLRAGQCRESRRSGQCKQSIQGRQRRQSMQCRLCKQNRMVQTKQDSAGRADSGDRTGHCRQNRTTQTVQAAETVRALRGQQLSICWLV